VATADAVQAVEEAIGCPLPPLLRRLFLQVACGGFGPGHGGILGPPAGQARYNGNWKDLVDAHGASGSGSGPDSSVPRHMLWLYDWGCAIWSLLDCSVPGGVMWVWDPNGVGEPSDKSLFCQGISLTEWLAAWLQGRLRQPRVSDDVPPNIPGQLTLFNGPGAGTPTCPAPGDTPY
jgi:hypothetical protein